MKILKFRIIFILNVRQLFGMIKKKKKKTRRHKIKILTDYQKQTKNFNMVNDAIKNQRANDSKRGFTSLNMTCQGLIAVI